MLLPRPVVHPIRIDDEGESRLRLTRCHGPSLAVGSLIDVLVDGDWELCRIVGADFGGVRVERVR